MSVATRPTLALILALVAAVVMAAVLVAAQRPASVNASTCDIQNYSGADNKRIYGFQEKDIEDLRGMSARIWNYHPTPIWGVSTATIGVGDEGTQRWAQVGWVKAWDPFSTYGSSRVFLQVQNTGGGNPHTRFYHSNGQWKSSANGAIVPDDEKFYEVYKHGNDWQIRYENGTVYNYSSSWEPDFLIGQGETERFLYMASGTDKGDHAPGDKSNKVQFNHMKKNVDGTWSDPSLLEAWRHDPMEVDTDNWGPGVGFRVWDDRCEN